MSLDKEDIQKDKSEFFNEIAPEISPIIISLLLKWFKQKEHLCKYVLHITDDQLSEVLRDINSFYYEKREPKFKKWRPPCE